MNLDSGESVVAAMVLCVTGEDEYVATGGAVANSVNSLILTINEGTPFELGWEIYEAVFVWRNDTGASLVPVSMVVLTAN